MTSPKPIVQNVLSQAMRTLRAANSLRLLSLLLFVGWFLACFLFLACFADPQFPQSASQSAGYGHSGTRNLDSDDGQDFAGDPELKPLVDHSKDVNPQDTPTSFHGNLDFNRTNLRQPEVLTGRVESLDNAIRIEQGEVDWYQWYLSARHYLSQTGGLDCSPGTPIRFNRSGVIQAQTGDMTCRISAQGKFYPLPTQTRLDAVILPVRQSIVPPATREELYWNIRRGARR